jgi:outer membrane receptor protein involved in Fe transport
MILKKKHPERIGRWLAPLLTLVLGLPGFAQTAANRAGTNEETKKKEDVLELSPFVVETSKDKGYFAQNTLAGSRMRTNLSDLGASITVVTKQQLEDTGSIDINDVFRYEANTEGSSTYTPAIQSLRNDGVVDTNAGYTHGGDGQPQTNAISNRVRGIGIPGASYNYYPANPSVPFDSYNIQSIEISRGPNSMLFGMGSPAGIVNQTAAQAVIGQDSARLALRTDNYGEQRASFAFNKSLIDDHLAIFGAVLRDNKKFARKPSYDNTRRLFGAITFKPFAKTVLRASLEDYRNKNNRPNTLTPRDTVTPWRASGSPSYDPSTGTIMVGGKTIGPIVMSANSPYIAQTRAYIESLPNFDPAKWNSAKTSYDGVSIVGTGAISNVNSILYTPGIVFPTTSRPIMQVYGGEVVDYFYTQPDRYRQVYGTPTNPAANAPVYPAAEATIFADPVLAQAYNSRWTQSALLPGPAGIGSYRYPGVTDRSIYDYTSQNILSSNFGADDNTTINVELEQELLPNLYLSAGWFRQDYKSVTNYTVSQLNVATIFVDTNTKYSDGSPNPFYGQPYVMDFDPDQFTNTEKDDNYRAMLAYTPDFTRHSGWTKWLGRHQLLGLATRQKVDRGFIRKRWFVTASDEAANKTIFFLKNPNNNADGTPTGWNFENRSVQRHYYLSEPNSTPDGAVTAASGAITASSYTGNMGYYDFDAKAWKDLSMTTGFIDHSATTGSTQRQVDSLSFGLTSYLWKERLVTTFGWRKDKYKARSTTTGAILDSAGGSQIAPGLTNPEKWVNGIFQTDLVQQRYNYWDQLSGITRTAGAVLKPFKYRNNIETRANNGSLFWQFVQDFGLSYNQSDNFNPPSAAQVDAFGNPLPKPTGAGKDYGFQFSLFDNKLFARVNWFKSTNENERTNPGTSISRLTGNVDTTLFRNWARTIALINSGQDPTLPNFGVGLTPAEEQQIEDATAQIWKQPYNYYDDVGSIYATRSAEAKGLEVTVTYNPTRNWTMKFTAGKQTTVYSNVLKEFDAWFAVRNPVWSAAKASDYLKPQYASLAKYTSAGGREVDLTTFWGGYGWDSNITLDNAFGLYNAQLYYDNIVTPQYAIARDLEGQASPGQRRYRWSYLSNYAFQEGRFKGFSVGGSVRWEDKAVIGYYGKANVGSTDLTLSDTTRPIYDSANTYYDFWVSYTRRLFNDKVQMKVQLNVVDAFENGGLKTVSVNYDGSPSAFRIVDPRQFILSATFDF